MARVHTVAVIGAGKIGELLLSGLLRAGWPADRLLATARRPERAEELAERYGVRVVDNLTAVAEADVLAIAVKPQDAGALLAELGAEGARRTSWSSRSAPACRPRSSPSGCPRARRWCGS